MPRFWTIACFVIACVAFGLAFLDFTPTLMTRRRTYAIQAPNWVGLGLLALGLVLLVNELEA